MRVTITKLRQELFRFADRAASGENIEFTHRGVHFKIVPEAPKSKLDRLIGQQVVADKGDLGQASRKLLREMRSEWEKDWSEL